MAYCDFFGVVSLVFCLLFQTIVIKNFFKRLLDLRYYYSGICHGSESFDCVLCEFGLFGPVSTRLKVVLCELVWCRVIKFCLLLWSIVRKIVFKTLIDVCHSYYVNCDGLKSFDIVAYEFR